MKHAAKLLAIITATLFSLGAAAQQQAVAPPDTSTAWILALGFLGLVVLRRTRPGPVF